MKKNPKFEIEDRIVIYENISKEEYLDLLLRTEHIRIIVCEDGRIYAWDGAIKTHEDIMRLLNQPNALGFNVGNYQFAPEEILDNVFKIAKKYKTRHSKKVSK